ncbi:MAG: peptide chain release factor N(5)-glutamine methyltransferase [SAR324 cluster bacterium]|uniref:Release factor glutamine methyltransferase n=1 Tax=SAR324 cluster bacterium TaxID=2024889 RepID=A0A7X9FTX2_9DELT|nr:peptide chain release factor N(5)-glutamine methyltransferase [SAR324 cluster bacterium]
MSETTNSKSIGMSLKEAAERLAAVSETSRLDAELLMQKILGLERHELICRQNECLSPDKEAAFEELVLRRIKHEPIAYIRGLKEFWGILFEVGPGVLIPRPATELLVELALAAAAKMTGELHIADLGTGSGAISVAIASELKNRNRNFKIEALDWSDEALRFAQKNVDRYGLRDFINLGKSNWFEALENSKSCFDIIVSNPPYIAEDDESVMPDLAYEPRQALFSGPEGLDAIRELLFKVPEYLKEGGAFFCEFGATQKELIENFIKNNEFLSSNFVCSFYKDLSNFDRALKLEFKQLV